ncbi:bifunctional dethiobiotin synthetase/7,8-diamino-pelargonic acid aminotransferase, mitochondrial [Iris pallida]|uniref:Bifunctional dethiobiotin synthetase/7,8-diamino-pelargonic acid aminotransferase, mitochondrial n=1 Tax=Iris pallida TaxID=29817 RepID=A0AAX6HHV9_IRIPA|nr:bifunctional dethiobiotin synthetase/7,8-diamino-pelargonic acid aminotransferase, mitochondrial [Iris pallida]
MSRPGEGVCRLAVEIRAHYLHYHWIIGRCPKSQYSWVQHVLQKSSYIADTRWLGLAGF